MQLAAIRDAFLTYFQTHGHTLVPSSSLVPDNDPTLLFTNAGMVQFKEAFLGLDKRAYTRATTAQRCVRAGGKHNDLDNVGYTARHHTFFEMLGNFSFGDYFKREAIHFAWAFLVDTLKLPREKLWVTVHQSDDEAAAIWLNDIKVDPARISRCGDKDNFWSMGDTGPCGPCTEIFYDHGPTIAGGPPGTPEADGDRYIEIWNLVFMQFNRSADGSMAPLPRPSVDTGMGLERIAAIMQGVHNNYDIDLFVALIRRVRDVLAVHDDAHVNSLRVIADHIRSSSFLIADGVLPSNEGRGYVLRRIIRRAIRHGHRVGAREPFFYRIVARLSELMGDAYPELRRLQTHIEAVLLKEEEQFAITLDQGLKLLEQAISQLTTNLIPGHVVFKLYDTYGFPVDLTADIARERDLHVDHAGFDVEMEKQRAQSKAASQFSTQRLLDNTIEIAIESEFHGYANLTLAAKVVGLFNANGDATESLIAGEGSVVLDKTPFYAESGGQVGDCGVLSFNGGSFAVVDTRKHRQAIVHIGQLSGASLRVGDTVTATVETTLREQIALNHSATHLLHAALRQLLGAHVQQKGSLVDADRLRFDFLHPHALSREECEVIEHIVNREIRANHEIATTLMSPDAAKAAGAMALFGEKYGDEVRVLAMGDFSRELCGGTHAKRTGDIGLFKIVSEAGIASGVRRIEAVTGATALTYMTAQQQTLANVAALLKVTPDSVLEKTQQWLATVKQLEKAHETLQQRMAVAESHALLAKRDTVAGIAILATRVDGATAKTVKDMLDPLKDAMGSGVILLAAVEGDTVSLVVGVTRDLTDRFHAGELVKYVAEQLGGKGGGRADMAQGGGTDAKVLPAALSSVQSWVRARIV